MSPKVKNLVLGAVAVVLLAVATYLFIAHGNPEAQYPTEYSVRTVCLESGEESPITSKMAERAPFVNPKTGRRTLYPWYFCQDCKYLFVPIPIPSGDAEPPRLPMVPTCANCGGQRTSSWDSSDPSQAHPAGKAKLPALPK